MAVRFVRAVGLLLLALGVVHLIATPHIPLLLRGSPRAVYQSAVGPTLLNHVLVGLLLLPLGYSTWVAGTAGERGEAWAKRVLALNTLVVFAMPILVAVFMRRPEYYRAPLFLTGVGLVTAISLLMGVAIYILSAPQHSSRR